MDTEISIKDKKDHILIVVAFLGLILIKAAIASKFSSPWVIADEMVYSEIANNILGGVFYSKLLYCQTYPPGYSLLLSIAFLFSTDKLIIYHIMLNINCILTPLIIFPSYFVLRIYTSRTITILGSILISVLPSVSLYTFAILSENAFIPLFTFSLWFLMESYRGGKRYWNFFAGFSIFFLLFTRTTGIAMIIGLFVSLLYYVKLKSNLKNFSDILNEKLPLAASLIIPLSLWIFYEKLFVPIGVGTYATENYLNTLLNALSNPQQYYTLISLFTHEIEFVILASYFVLPSIILLFINFDKIRWFKILPFDTKWTSLNLIEIIALKASLVYFFISSFVLLVITITHMIMGLNRGQEAYLIFNRYLDPTIPLIFIFGILGIELFCRESIANRSRLKIIIIYILITLSFAYTFPHINYKIGNTLSLYHLQNLKNFVPIQTFILSLLSTSFIGSYLYIYKKRYRAYLLLCFIFLSIFLSSYTINSEIEFSSYIKERSQIGEYLQYHSDKNTIILVDDTPYLNYPKIDANMWFTTQFWTKGLLIRGAIDENFSNMHNSENRISYIISARTLPIELLPCSGSIYKLYIFKPEQKPGQDNALIAKD